MLEKACFQTGFELLKIFYFKEKTEASKIKRRAENLSHPAQVPW